MTKSKREVENLKTQHNDSIEWEQAEGFSKYLISTDGQVYSLKSDRLLPQGFTHRGYKQVDVCNDEGIKKAHEGSQARLYGSYRCYSRGYANQS